MSLLHEACSVAIINKYGYGCFVLDCSYDMKNLNVCCFRPCDRSWVEITLAIAAMVVSHLYMLAEALFLPDTCVWCPNVHNMCDWCSNIHDKCV